MNDSESKKVSMNVVTAVHGCCFDSGDGVGWSGGGVLAVVATTVQYSSTQFELFAVDAGKFVSPSSFSALLAVVTAQNVCSFFPGSAAVCRKKLQNVW